MSQAVEEATKYAAQQLQYMQGRPDNAGSPSAAIKHATDIIRKQLEGAVSGSGSEEEPMEDEAKKASDTFFSHNGTHIASANTRHGKGPNPFAPPGSPKHRLNTAGSTSG